MRSVREQPAACGWRADPGWLCDDQRMGGADVILINEAKNRRKLQICKYEEDACGNLTAPQGDACFAVRLHSFAYQEILMLKAENDYCVALEQLPKGCYDIRRDRRRAGAVQCRSGRVADDGPHHHR